MKLVHTLLRLALGALLLVFGINKFLWFMPDFDFTGYPDAEYLFNALRFSGPDPAAGKGYILHLVGATESIVGLLLLLNRYIGFAFVMLVPISINIVFFHLLLNIPNIAPALVVALLNGYFIYRNWDKYKLLFT